MLTDFFRLVVGFRHMSEHSFRLIRTSWVGVRTETTKQKKIIRVTNNSMYNQPAVGLTTRDPGGVTSPIASLLTALEALYI